jgi:hypothetical protein
MPPSIRRPDARYTQMDAAFIQQNQIIERYLMGRLPLKGAQDFERFCRENPEVVSQLGLSDRINAALRLMDAAGEAQPWTEKPLKSWQSAKVVGGIAGVAVVSLIAVGVLALSVAKKSTEIAAQKKELQTQPLLPVQATRSLVIKPSRSAATSRSVATVGAGRTELADLKLDVSWSQYSFFRVTIDRVDQGLVAVLGNVARDSNGHLRFALNSSALGPGEYQVTIEGLDKWGKPVPEASTRFTSAR